MSILSAVDCGTLKMIPTDYIGTSYIINSPVTTTWETADLSAYVPNGAKAVLLAIRIYVSGTGDADMILCLRDYGSSGTLNVDTYRLQIYANGGSSLLLIGADAIVRVTDGKFQFAETASRPIDRFQAQLLGYYI
jgi:hypothetical protein